MKTKTTTLHGREVDAPAAGLACKFIVIQVHPTAHPADKAIVSNALTQRGVLLPMSMDGFYAHIEDAEDIAAMLREDFPTIDVYVAEVRSKNGQPA